MLLCGITLKADDRARGELLTIRVDPAQVPVWGYWVSRGGWYGHTHIALEATNAPADALAELPPGPAAHALAPRETRTWRVSLTLDASASDLRDQPETRRVTISGP